MKGFWKTVGFLIALAIFSGTAAGGLYAIHYVWTLFTALDDRAGLVVAAVSGVAVVCTWMIAAAVRSAASRWAVQVSTRNRAATYRRFAVLWTERLYGAQGYQGSDNANLEQHIETLDMELALYGSAAVIGSHAALRSLCRDDAFWEGAARDEFLKGLIAVRRDLGVGDWRVQARELDALLSRDGAPVVGTGSGHSDRRSTVTQTA